MRSRIGKVMCCLLSIVLLSSMMTELAYAPPGNIEAYEKYKEWLSSDECREATEKFKQAREYGQLRAEGGKIASRIEALPDNITEENREEVESIRHTYDQWKKEVDKSWESATQEYPNSGSMSPGLVADLGVTQMTHIRKLENAEKQLEKLGSSKQSPEQKAKSSAPKQDAGENKDAVFDRLLSALADPGQATIIYILLLAWYGFFLIQAIMAYGTAYRKTKANGDNGVSLFGWLIVYNLAALIPFLGIYLWSKSKK